jgi:hypothetical protein
MAWPGWSVGKKLTGTMWAAAKEYIDSQDAALAAVDDGVLDAVNGEAVGQGWTNAAYAAGWQSFDSGGLFKGVRYRKIGAVVYVQGSCSRSTTSPAASTIFTLPAGFRPTDRKLAFAALWAAASDSMRRVDVDTAGNVIEVAGGITSASLLALNFSFPAT